MTAKHVLAALHPDRYEITAIGIDRQGSWSRCQPHTDASGLDPVGDPIDPFSTFRDAALRGGVVLPLLHGPLGEDGTVQGLCELAGIPYAGSGVLGSALSMDKIAAKHALDAAGIAQARWIGLHSDEVSQTSLAGIQAELGSTIFVKPANMGSSVGVSKATDAASLAKAAAVASDFDEWLVFEEAVVGREIEISVLGNRVPRVSVPGEIVAGADFYTYEDKYEDGVAQLLIPAPLTDSQVVDMGRLAIAAYRALRVEGLARADFFFEEHGRGWLCNELNTMPGFTPISMYPKMWEASGLAYSDLIDELVDLAFERHQRRQR